jgi:hypothetical protein
MPPFSAIIRFLFPVRVLWKGHWAAELPSESQEAAPDVIDD